MLHVQFIRKDSFYSQGWWHIPLTLALRMLRQEDQGFKINLGYIARPCLIKTNNKQKLHIVLTTLRS